MAKKKIECPFCGKKVSSLKDHLLEAHPREAANFEYPEKMTKVQEEELNRVYDRLMAERKKKMAQRMYITIGAVAIVAVLIAIALFNPFAAEKEKKSPASAEESSSVKHTIIVIQVRNYGNIKIELYDDKAPKTVENILKYVHDGFYDGLIFHRVVHNFVIQTGGYYRDSDGNLQYKEPTYPPIPNEAAKSKMRNVKYSVAMARTSDPNSATSQFYINLADNDFLDWDKAQDGYGYCVFGMVIEGFDVVDNIGAVETHTENGMQDVPVNDVVIDRVYIAGEKVVTE